MVAAHRGHFPATGRAVAPNDFAVAKIGGPGPRRPFHRSGWQVELLFHLTSSRVPGGRSRPARFAIRSAPAMAPLRAPRDYEE
jgi:hypothetical protein